MQSVLIGPKSKPAKLLHHSVLKLAILSMVSIYLITLLKSMKSDSHGRFHIRWNPFNKRISEKYHSKHSIPTNISPTIPGLKETASIFPLPQRAVSTEHSGIWLSLQHLDSLMHRSLSILYPQEQNFKESLQAPISRQSSINPDINSDNIPVTVMDTSVAEIATDSTLSSTSPTIGVTSVDLPLATPDFTPLQYIEGIETIAVVEANEAPIVPENIRSDESSAISRSVQQLLLQQADLFPTVRASLLSLETTMSTLNGISVEFVDV